MRHASHPYIPESYSFVVDAIWRCPCTEEGWKLLFWVNTIARLLVEAVTIRELQFVLVANILPGVVETAHRELVATFAGSPEGASPSVVGIL